MNRITVIHRQMGCSLLPPMSQFVVDKLIHTQSTIRMSPFVYNCVMFTSWLDMVVKDDHVESRCKNDTVLTRVIIESLHYVLLVLNKSTYKNCIWNVNMKSNGIVLKELGLVRALSWLSHVSTKSVLKPTGIPVTGTPSISLELIVIINRWTIYIK